MAEIKDVKLQILPSSDIEKKSATVSFKLAFSSTEAGQTFRYGINLYGEDKMNDDEPGSLLSKGQLLYTFKFGLFSTYKNVTAQPGEQSFTEPREVSIKKLNEDPDFYLIDVDINTPPVKIPHPDEVYASVILVADEERSDTYQLVL
jgi:hypothetical protein